jgi:hypothetical protein
MLLLADLLCNNTLRDLDLEYNGLKKNKSLRVLNIPKSKVNNEIAKPTSLLTLDFGRFKII